MARRRANRKPRSQRPKQRYRMKYYLILTDAEKTEVNYFNGLKESLSPEVREKIVIEVRKSKSPHTLLNDAERAQSKDAQIREVWLVFDRDEVSGFDDILVQAQVKGFNVAWSNPCFEIWLHAYFGEMPISHTSGQCIQKFKNKYDQIIGQEYSKDSGDLYDKLSDKGDEEKALKISKLRLEEYSFERCRASEMYGATKVFELVEDIRSVRD